MKFFNQALRISTLSIVALYFISNSVFGQTKLLMGNVSDAQNNQPLEYATVYWQSSHQGTTTDSLGNFEIAYSQNDSLLISEVGYVLVKLTPTVAQSFVQVQLSAATIELDDITIVAGENPADGVVKMILSGKEIHNKDNFSSYEYEAYNKIEFDVNNFNEKLKNKKIIKPFAFAFENIDTSAGKQNLPMFLTESLSDYYYQKTPFVNKEVIKASKVSGIKNESISQFLGTSFQDINIYDNFINLFDVSFISPLNDNALFFYNYYIIDSALQENGMAYELKFKPRRPNETTFAGTFWVDMSDYAISQIEMKISTKANINFINDFEFTQNYFVADDHWMPENESVLLDFKMESKMLGVRAKKYTSYKNVEVGESLSPEMFASASSIQYQNGVLNLSDEFWNTHRHTELTAQQANVYSIMDSIQNSPTYKTYYTLFNTVGTGYWTQGNFEIGPFYNFYSQNIAEQNRFRFGGRTSNAFSTKLMVYGYLAYGTLDRTWKYNGGLLYMLGKSPRSSISIDVKKDFEFSGNEFTDFGTDNIFSSFFRRNVPQKFAMVNSITAQYEKEWGTGFSSKFIFTHKEVLPDFNFTFAPVDQSIQLNSQPVNITEVTYALHYAYQEKFYTGEFIRTSYGSKYPIVELKYSVGMRGIVGGDLSYHKIMLDVSDHFKVPYIGKFDYQVTAGKILGTLPSIALFNARGNESYYYNPYTYTGLNDYEFVSDAFVGAFITQHLGGFLFNKVPGIQKLKWRSLVTAKALYGSMTDANRTANTGNYFIVPDKVPYLEVGTGIENIFKIFRVDAFWRLTYLDAAYSPKFGIRGSIQFGF